MPPLEEFTVYLHQIWESRILTNNGPFHQQFEKELADYLGVKYLSLFANGTLALVTALQALKVSGEVITTPFSFVATTHSLWWNNIRPVFVDIEPERFTIDPARIEAAITPNTTAIMAVHVYGNPCYTDAIQKIADTYGLKVIYDAAHAFGVKENGVSVLNCGDLSILSFHATKRFSTIEGGAIVCHDEKTKKRIDFLKNFGFADEVTVVGPGINAKMNELQAAFGLVQLRHIDDYIIRCGKLAGLYRERLSGIKGLRLPVEPQGVRHSHTYFPVLVDEKEYGESRDAVYERLRSYNIYGRRYFYPLISNFPTYRGLPSAVPENLPVANRASGQVICLPLYPHLEAEVVETVCEVLGDGR
ncbi:MAG TPA: aminotransferase [Bacteroidales bacterium]|nr:aminotransferase [Bacteroidales bacterium]